MERSRTRRVARRMCGAAGERSDAGASPDIALSAGRLAEHQELVAAIRRVEAGTYGLCLICEAPIEYERLAHNPKAAHCNTCVERVTRTDDRSASA